VSPATARAIAELLRAAGSPPRPILKVQVLDDEAAGGDPSLRAVAAGTLAKGDWSGAEKKLKDYLSIRRTPELRALARFYLGQAYWFQGRPREAFFEFLGCEDALPRESRAWQDACLGELAARG
jgi:TolA-binding protein